MERNRVEVRVPYFQAPNDIFEIGLDKFEILTYLYLSRLGNQGGKAFPSYNTIGKKTGMSKRKAIESVKSLKEKGLVTVHKRFNEDLGENYTNIYLVDHELVNSMKGSAHDAPGGEYSAPGYAQHAPNKELVYKEIDKKNRHQPSDHRLSIAIEIYESKFGKPHPSIESHEDRFLDILDSFDLNVDEVSRFMHEHLEHEHTNEENGKLFYLFSENNGGYVYERYM